MADGNVLRFSVLGPVRAWRGEKEIELGAFQPRCVLAVLLLRRERAVSRDEIITAVWGDRTPRRAAAAVHTYISGLRRVLDHKTSKIICLGRTGYQLAPGAYDLDLDAFHADVATARRARAHGNLDAAATRFTRALARWHGEALSGLSGPFAETERALLAEMHLSVLEECFDAQLKLGRPEPLERLSRLVTEHPFRERFREQLMMALHLDGRQSAAIEVFHETRLLLDEELGVEPGPSLRRLYERILANTPVTEELRPVTVPVQLPADVADFTGRAQYVAQIQRILGEFGAGRGTAPPVCVIAGAGGVGKTTLAVHVAHLMRRNYPDGLLHVDLQGATANPMPPIEVLARFLRALGVADRDLPRSESERAAMYRTLVSGRRLLVILDNARDVRQVLPLLPGDPENATLLTSRDPLVTLPGAHRVNLDVFSASESATFLTRITGTRETHGTAQVARYCGHLPLALRIAGARAHLVGQTLTVYADRLRDQHQRLAELEVADLSLRASFGLSYQLLREQVDETAARAFRLLGLIDAHEVTLGVIARAADASAEEAEEVVAGLTRLQFLVRSGPGRYRMHDLIRLYAAERAREEEPERQQRSATIRVLRWYVAAAQCAARLIQPEDKAPVPSDEIALPQLVTPEEAIAWFRAERQNLLVVVRQGGDLPEAWPLSCRLVSALYWLFRADGQFGEWAAGAVRALHAARAHADFAAIAQLTDQLANLRLHQGNDAGSVRYLHESAHAYQRLRDIRGEIRAQINIGVIHHRMGKPAKAVRRYEIALDRAEKAAYPRAAAYALMNLAAAHRDQGDHGAALDSGTRAISLLRDIGDREGEADALDDLAKTHRSAGRHTDAVVAHEAGLAVVRELRLRHKEVALLCELGDTCLQADRPSQATSALELALTIAREIRDQYGEGRTLLRLGKAAQALGDEAGARRQWQAALRLLQAGDTPEVAEVCALLDSSIRAR
ncbi:AfsR/SARP family transcriptional regulator [Nonomuraea jiangxiensis]|uniref:DNA-binding transcriptional activator of the SARP family n=1 Tax=Nonomuraea jiangxiensis TaxID=633440 RepID=A0A1G7Z1T4_9ACTN|nr:BTAD domain-containing putative transcriptional regulator [Nonomuraea jiangxiensis]SDH02525.1 DNA-binding transcriptional activator of the SARP family [Nonomuraea jiangxiensis]